MRSINVSTDVYAAIWAARQTGEDHEDAILSRLLNLTSTTVSKPLVASKAIGFRDSRYGIELPEGFEIFRSHKGTDYRATASGGQWELVGDGRKFSTLNKLSMGTSGNTENAWRNWYFRGTDGKRYLVEGLRNDIPNNVRHLA